MKQIAELEITDNKKLILSIGEYRGSERVDLRQYVKVDDDYIPTKKGINFDSEWTSKFIEMIDKLKDIQRLEIAAFSLAGNQRVRQPFALITRPGLEIERLVLYEEKSTLQASAYTNKFLYLGWADITR